MIDFNLTLILRLVLVSINTNTCMFGCALVVQVGGHNLLLSGGA